MQWLRTQLSAILTSIVLLIGLGITYGHLDSRQQELTIRQAEFQHWLSLKVDRDQVIRELDQVRSDLTYIRKRLDGVIIRQAIVADP
jgi:hypothetical protein